MDKRWVYYTVVYHHGANVHARYLLTANDVTDAEKRVLSTLPKGWTAHYSEMVCSTTDHELFKEL